VHTYGVEEGESEVITCSEQFCGRLIAVRFAYFCGMKRVDGFEGLVIDSIPEFCRLMELPPPEHPLVSVIRFEWIKRLPADWLPTVVLNFFSVWLKKEAGIGVMRFFLPGQPVEGELNECGCWLMIHPELLWNYSVERNLDQYGFFVDSVSAALRLAGKEEKMMSGILQNIEQEYLPPVSACCQEAILSHVETLFIYADRFYRRQLLS
jgi:hypothetical protein